MTGSMKMENLYPNYWVTFKNVSLPKFFTESYDVNVNLLNLAEP